MERILRNSRVLVTGGAGFIGSNLIESLLNAGNQVVCLDNFSTGKRENLKDFTDNPHFNLIEGDIRNYSDCEKSVRNIDIVFHQAALGSVPRSIKDPVSSTDVNIGGFVKMLFAAKEAGVKRFIYAASSSTYGDHPDLPKVEDKIGSPLSPYAITKYVDELFAANFANNYGIDVIGLRYFNVFGRRQDPDGAYAAVIPKFVKMLMKHEVPLINGDGYCIHAILLISIMLFRLIILLLLLRIKRLLTRFIMLHMVKGPLLMSFFLLSGNWQVSSIRRF